MAVETLNIKVTDSGSSREVGMSFRAMAAEILAAGNAYKKLKQEMKGLKGPKSSSAGPAAALRQSAAASEAAKNNLKKLSAVSDTTTHSTNQLTAAQIRQADLQKRLNSSLIMGTKNIKNAGVASETFKEKVTRLAKRLTNLRTVMFALGGTVILRGLLSMIDQYQNMGNRIRLVTRDTQHFAEVQGKLFTIAKETRQSLTATVETYVRLSKATDGMGISQERLMGSLKTLNQMIALSGATAIEAEQSIRQISQAFSKGKLDGDEFRSVSEAMPDVLTALSKSMGATRGELRKMSEQGKITTEALLEAFEAVKDSTAEDFAKSTKTLGQAWQVLKDEVLKSVGAFDESTGASSALTSAMGALAAMLPTIVNVVKLLVFYFGTKLAITIATKLPSAFRILRAEMMATAATAKLSAASVTGVFVAAYLGARELSEQKDVSRFSDTMAGLDETYRMTPEEQVKRQILVQQDLRKDLESMKKMESNYGKAKIQQEMDQIDNQLVMLNSLWDQITAQERLNQLVKENKEELKRTSTAWKSIEAAMEPQRIAAEKTKMQFDAATAKAWERMEAAKKEAEKRKEIYKYTAETAEKERLIRKYISDTAAANAPGVTQRTEAKTQIEALDVGKKYREEQIALGKTKKEAYALGVAYGEAYLEKVKLTSVIGATVDEGPNKKDRVATEVSRVMEYTAALREAQKESEAYQESLNPKKTKKDGTLDSLNSLLDSLDPVRAAMRKLQEQQDLLTKAQKRGLITTKEAAQAYQMLKVQAREAIYPVEELYRQARQGIDDASLSQEAADRLNRQRAIEADILKDLGPAHTALAHERAIGLEQMEHEKELIREATTDRLAMVDSINHEAVARKELAKQIAAVAAAQGTGAVSSTEAKNKKDELRLSPFKLIAKDVEDMRNGFFSLNVQRAKELAFDKEMLALRKEISAAQSADAITQKEALLLTEKRVKAQEAFVQAQIMADDKRRVAAIQGDIEAAKEKARQEDKLAGIRALFDAQVIHQLQVNALADSYTALEDGIINLVVNGKGEFDTWTDALTDMFRTMTEQILADLTRILIRMALVQAFSIGSAGGGATFGRGLMAPGFRHGGGFTVDRTPRFAHGGGFSVGGAGGPDTQLVQFLASPGENVKITNPGQSRMDNKESSKGSSNEPVSIRINNFMDPNEIPAAMASPAGERTILNVLQKNGTLVKRLLR